MSAPLVVGVDLSITATGICDHHGRCTTAGGPATAGDRRLVTTVDAVLAAIGIDGWVAKHTLVVIEGLAIHGPGGAMAAAQLMGAVKVALMDHGSTYVEVPPATLKKYATGKGNATKADMAVALYKRAGIELANDNEVDAWWLRAAGLHHLGHPIVDVPAAQAAALDRVTWPVPLERPTPEPCAVCDGTGHNPVTPPEGTFDGGCPECGGTGTAFPLTTTNPSQEA